MYEALETPEEYPRVIFKLRGTKYCVSSEFVCLISVPDQIHSMPEGKPYHFGIIHLDNQVIPILNMRVLLKMRTLEEELAQFATMKQKHIDWVETLEKSLAENTAFLLPSDPKRCAFGLWYYGYHTDNLTLRFILKKIEAPHDRMHYIAHEIEDYRRAGLKEQVQQRLSEAKKICDHEILPLLDRLIEAWRDTNKGILVVLEQGQDKIGIYVDEVVSLISLNESRFTGQSPTVIKKWENLHLVKEVLSDPNGDVLLDINVDSIFQLD